MSNPTFKELLEKLEDQNKRWNEAVTALGQREGAVAPELVEELEAAFRTTPDAAPMLAPFAIRI